MRLKQLESALSQVRGFSNPKPRLEQYPTPSHVAARMIFSAEENHGDIDSRQVLDLGCGPGILGIASALADAEVVGVDIDPSALEAAVDNAEELDADVEFVLADVIGGGIPGPENTGAGPGGTIGSLRAPFREDMFDTVVMNPPFGTKRDGVDMNFLAAAVTCADTAVYSLHKSSTRDYILKTLRGWGCEAEVVSQVRFDIPSMYKFHKKKNVSIEVDYIRADVREKDMSAVYRFREEKARAPSEALGKLKI